MFDMMLTFFTCLGILGMVISLKEKNSQGYLYLIIAFAGGLLAKGPTILLQLLPLALTAPWWCEKKKLAWKSWYSSFVISFLVGVAILLCWAIPAGISGGAQYQHDIFWGQTANRMVNSFAHNRPQWWYLEMAPLLIFPWFFVPSFWKLIFQRSSKKLSDGYSYSEWYRYRLFEKKKEFIDFHNKNYGSSFAYEQFEPMFKAEMFEPKQWAELFKKSGAKYVVLTSKHHDGYTLWNSAEADRDWNRPWNAVTGTPKRDLLGDLSEAVRNSGLRMGYYYSLYEWFNPMWLHDRKKYVEKHMTPQFKDLVTKYKPEVIFSDGEWDISDTAWKSPELLAWLFNESPVKDNVVVNDRWGNNTREKNHGAMYTTSEYGSGMDASIVWEESQGIGSSYGYNRNEQLKDYKSSRELILMLNDIVSRGGNFLLDIKPNTRLM